MHLSSSGCWRAVQSCTDAASNSYFSSFLLNDHENRECMHHVRTPKLSISDNASFTIRLSRQTHSHEIWAKSLIIGEPVSRDQRARVSCRREAHLQPGIRQRAAERRLPTITGASSELSKSDPTAASRRIPEKHNETSVTVQSPHCDTDPYLSGTRSTAIAEQVTLVCSTQVTT